MRRLALCLALAFLPSCAHGPGPAAVPDFTPIAGEPAPPQARLIADCIGQAAATGAYRRARDADAELLLFTCAGAPARAFFDGLAGRSARVGSEARVGDRVLRSTNPVRENLFGVDYCWSGPSGDYGCVVSLNVGEFLAE